MATQQSHEAATRHGITALEQAYSGIFRCQQDVQSTRFALSGGYGGCDGNKYQKLLEQWDDHVDTILVNLDRMVRELNGTLVEHRRAQGSANDAIDGEFKRSREVFSTLNPDKGHYRLRPLPESVALPTAPGFHLVRSDDGTVTRVSPSRVTMTVVTHSTRA
ncbi:hypothetical protein [Streptomyces sp. NPDC051636]|uniref:hypothetical protein n=1 Tax=Streptomyces sp. NPDC051636 TaxID=3365663 RepID=UPI0037B00499